MRRLPSEDPIPKPRLAFPYHPANGPGPENLRPEPGITRRERTSQATDRCGFPDFTGPQEKDEGVLHHPALDHLLWLWPVQKCDIVEHLDRLTRAERCFAGSGHHA